LDEPEEEVDVGVEEAQTIGCLHEVRFVIAADFMRDDQGGDFARELLAGAVRHQPLGDDPGTALRVQPLVDGIVE
jgi:hypothetical protein